MPIDKDMSVFEHVLTGSFISDKLLAERLLLFGYLSLKWCCHDFLLIEYSWHKGQ